jgi:hypothetical protein
MFTGKNGGNAALYLCESHAHEVGLSRENGNGVPALTEEPQNSVPSARAADVQVAVVKEPVAVAPAPSPSPSSSHSAEVLADEAIADMPPENFEEYATAFKLPPAPKEEPQTAESDLVHVCSRYAERCTYEATVHCPKCGRWFCDAHAEDGQWHRCALTHLEN